jgi:hypothetical protein
MNPSNGHKDHRVSSIYREGAWPEPSRQIDQAILAASRRAVRERHPAFIRWAPPVAIAATVLLTSSLVLKVYLEQPDAVSPSGHDMQSAPRARQGPPAEEKTVEVQAPPKAPAPEPAAPPPGFSSTIDAGEAARLDQMQRDLGTIKLSAPPSESPVPEPRPAPVLKKEAARPATPTTAAAPPGPTQQTARAIAKPAQPFTQAPVRLETAPTAAEAAPSPAQAAAVSGISGALKAPERAPQSWIEDIRKLLKEGKSEEAGEEIAKLKKQYPGLELPEDLR